MEIVIATVVLIAAAVFVARFTLGAGNAAVPMPMRKEDGELAGAPSLDASRTEGSLTDIFALDDRGRPVLVGRPGMVEATRGVTTALSPASPLAQQITRLGILRRGAQGTYRMIVSAEAATAVENGTSHMMKGSVPGRIRGPVVGAKGIVEQAEWEPQKLTNMVSSELLWGVAAFAVGHHFQAVIAKQLRVIEAKLDDLARRATERDLASVGAARRELQLAAARILDGVPPAQVVAGLSAQIQAVGTAWEQVLTWLDGLESSLESLPERPTPGILKQRLPSLLGDTTGTFFADARHFVVALTAQLQLLIVRAEDAGARDSERAYENYAAVLAQEAGECRGAQQRLRRCLHQLARLPLTRDGFLGRGTGMGCAAEALRDVLLLEDLLHDLRLPLIDLDVADYELVVRSGEGGAVVIEMPRLSAVGFESGDELDELAS